MTTYLRHFSESVLVKGASVYGIWNIIHRNSKRNSNNLCSFPWTISYIHGRYIRGQVVCLEQTGAVLIMSCPSVWLATNKSMARARRRFTLSQYTRLNNEEQCDDCIILLHAWVLVCVFICMYIGACLKHSFHFLSKVLLEHCYNFCITAIP